MTPEQFCYWLQGIFEIQTAGLDRNEKAVVKLTESQIDMIALHLRSVFELKIMVTQPAGGIGGPGTGGAGGADDFFPQHKPSVIC